MNKDTFVSLALAILISGGLLALIARQLPQASVQSEPPPSAREPAAQGAEAGTAPAADTATAATMRTLSLDEVRAACVAEVRNSNLKEGEEWACALYEKTSRPPVTPPPSNRPPQASSPDSEPQREHAARSSQPRNEAERPEPDHSCSLYPYGTIDYRKCRGREKDRLLERCRRTTARAEATLGPTRQQMKEIARAHCRTAELYQIIN